MCVFLSPNITFCRIIEPEGQTNRRKREEKMVLNLIITLVIFAIFTAIIAMNKQSGAIAVGTMAAFAVITGIKVFLEEWLLLVNYTNGYLLFNIVISLIIGLAILWLMVYEDHEGLEVTATILSLLVIVGIVVFSFVDDAQNQNKFDALEIVDAEVSTLDFNEKEVYKVDQDFALNKILKSLSEVPNHAYFEIKTINLMKVNEELVYVAELGHKGFFKWQKQKTIPGYFTLSATDLQEKVEFVDFPYEYSDYSYFGNYASRVLHGETKNEMVGSSHFELDDKGTPYYIQAVQKPVVFMSGSEEKAVATINLVNGEVKTYELDKTPEWIEDSIGSDQAAYIAEIRGEYPKGSFNFSNEGKTTPNLNGEENGTKPVFIGGKKYYFVEFSTYGNEGDSMDDALLIDARSGQASKIDFAEPLMDSNGAVKIGVKKYVEKQWHGVNPMLYNIDGTPTWIYSLLDSNDYHQKFVLVNAKNHSIAEDDANIAKALSKYKDSLAKGIASTSVKDAEALPEKNKEITIHHIAYVSTEDGYNFYIKTTDGEKYVYATNHIEELIFNGTGDKLNISFKDTGDIKTIISFK